MCSPGWPDRWARWPRSPSPRSPCARAATASVFAATVLFVMALSFATVNGWWYVSNFGVPWSNQFPEWKFGFTTMLLGLSRRRTAPGGVVPFLRARRVSCRTADALATYCPVAVGDCDVGARRVRGSFADPGDDRPVSGVERRPVEPRGGCRQDVRDGRGRARRRGPERRRAETHRASRSARHWAR